MKFLGFSAQKPLYLAWQEVTGRRFSLSMISAVSPCGEFRFMLRDGSVNAEVFREFHKRLMIGAKQPVFLIVDGHPIHKA